MTLFCLILVIVIAGVSAGDDHEQFYNVANETVTNDELKMNNYTTIGLETDEENVDLEPSRFENFKKDFKFQYLKFDFYFRILPFDDEQTTNQQQNGTGKVELDSRFIFDVPTSTCPPGEKKDRSGRCKKVV